MEQVLTKNGADGAPSPTPTKVNGLASTHNGAPLDTADGAQPQHNVHNGNINGTQNDATTRGAKAVRPPKPEALRVQAKKIPGDLKSFPNWLVWNYTWKEGTDGKSGTWDKPPFQAKAPKRHAQSTNPATWADFDTAHDAYEREQCSGIGFAVDPQTPVAVDLDGVRNPVTKEISAEGRAVVALLDTYTEISPSGTGLRLFAYGVLPSNARKKTSQKNGKPFEIYATGKYLTVTGHHLDGTPSTIYKRDEQLLEFHARYMVPKNATPSESPRAAPMPDNLALDDNTLLDKAMNAKNGDNFAALWEGHTIKGASEDDAALCFLLAFWTRKDAGRMEQLLRSSGRVRDKWDEKRGDSTWIKKEIENAIHHCRDVYDPTHPALRAPDPAKVAAQNACDEQDEGEPDSDEQEQNDERAPDEQPLKITLGYPTTDTGNAERFIAQHGHRFLFSAALGWMIWDGARWMPDERGRVFSWEKRTVRSIYVEAQQETDERRPIVAKWAASSEATAKRAAMMVNVQKDGPNAIPLDFDTDKLLFNVQNGTLDLRTGELHPHRQSDRMSKISPIRFDARATCPLWIDTLLTIFEGDEKLVRFVQLALGYCLTGLTREQCFFVLFGKGANGKSLLLSILREVIGEYQKHTAASTLMQKRGDAIPNDVAMLRGARLVTSIETNEGRKMDEALVKALTGDDPFTARFFRKEFFTFAPEFKIFLATNHKPQIVGTDDGIWRRIRLIPFNVRFWDADKGERGPDELRADKTLLDKLKGELPGILNWALEGCLSWQRDGIPSPKAVRDATGEYRDECDPIAQFLDECAVVDERLSIPKGDLHKAFARWAKDNELPAMSLKMFGTRLKEKGFTDKQKTGGARFWLGVALMTFDAEPQEEAPKHNTKRKF